MTRHDDSWINVREVGSLQKAMDLLPPEGGTVYLPTGTVAVDQTVVKKLDEKQHLFLVGDGRGSVIVNENVEGCPLMHITGVVGSWWPDLRITIRDITFVGNHKSGDALVIDYPNDAMIDACAFFGHGGTAVCLQPNGTNVVVRDCWMRDCKRALFAVNIHHLTLHGNQTRSANDGQTQDEHVYIGKHCFEVRIVNNHFAYGHREGIIIQNADQNVVANNTIEGFCIGVKAIDCRDIVLNSNYLRCPRAIELNGHCSGFAIAGNVCHQSPEGVVVLANAAGGGAHSITGNVMRRSADRPWALQGGVDLGSSERCVVTGNVIEECTTMPAISAGPGGGRHLITNNSITRCTTEPIDIKDAPDCVVNGNLITKE